MGSLRNPIGPLPSSIYWRRRAVALAMAVLALLVVVWMLTSGGGDDDKTDGANKSSPPASSITPGPKPSGPAISQQPGGRDETGDGGDSSGGDATGGSSEGTDGTGGTGTDDGGTSQGTGGAGGSGSSGGSEGRPVAVGSNLPNCSTDTLKLSLEPTKLTYPLGEKPGFRLKAVNSSSGDCKVDLGRSSAVLTVTDADDERIWSSNDCPRDRASLLLRVPANTTITHTYEWDRSRSTGHCSTAAPAKVGAGTYLLEAKFPGETVSPASFVLAKD
ncbi:hypothetical protein ABZ714_13475 [Streptomyces sp. NPDC006798]|uniref:hypothetical protein n=1 Tax=Streptomyces sp. NPDC006798 TaxID=3155462 RepID=UPI0033EA587C